MIVVVLLFWRLKSSFLGSRSSTSQSLFEIHRQNPLVLQLSGVRVTKTKQHPADLTLLLLSQVDREPACT
ncbi:unnamed protein product [Amoebophrya sp. A25]|nr:unnamed protein product [Amoebophrya sp. A25]|eukprot:GSA25T00011836001.1